MPYPINMGTTGKLIGGLKFQGKDQSKFRNMRVRKKNNDMKSEKG